MAAGRSTGKAKTRASGGGPTWRKPQRAHPAAEITVQLSALAVQMER